MKMVKLEIQASSTTEALRDFYAGSDWSRSDFAQHNDKLAEDVLSLLGPLPGKRVLDLGCGSASLGIELASRGFDVTGLDLWVEPARRRMAARDIKIRLIEEDMRLINYDEKFDAVINWDISGIGLLATDQENIDVVRRVHHALIPDGKFLIETYNSGYARMHAIEGLHFDSTDSRLKGRIRNHDFSVRLFSLSEWQEIFKDLGFNLLKTCGSLSGKPFQDTSMTLVMVAEKQRNANQQVQATPDLRRYHEKN
jgi:2-polyprenyl-3-methyl-5-hydroxy-6-metoxy-1,4-benzoquinol methylase